MAKKPRILVRASHMGDVAMLKDHLREADQMELRAGGSTPYTALMNGLKLSSPHAYTVQVNGFPVAMFGVVPVANSNFGVIWFLGTDKLLEIKWQFLRQSKYYLDMLSRDYQLLFNDVHHDNKLHIRWLKWLGFSFMHYNPKKSPFIEFAKIPCVNQLASLSQQ